MDDDSYLNLIKRCRAGEERAADEIFNLYADHLVGLVRNRLTGKMASRVDAEDVIQSVFRSFFVATRAGRFELQNGGDLWRLLVVLALHKLRTLIKFNNCARRDVQRDQSLTCISEKKELSEFLVAQGPSPLAASTLADEVEKLMSRLTPLRRHMLEMRLQGYNLEEIALQTRRSVRTVSRTLEVIKGHLLEAEPDLAPLISPQGDYG